MEWREQSTVSCEVAFAEARRWVEVVTGKRFGSSNFRSALENGVLLCDLINKLKPGIIRRVNRLSTPIAGLDNVNVFLRACGKLGLNHSQLFHPGDLQDISNRVTVRREETTRRLKNVLITIYWLGRKAQADPVYSGPQLNFKAFEGLLGVALSKVLEESSCPKAGVSARDGGHSEVWQEPLGTQTHGYRRGHSVESLDSLSAASDHTLLMASEGFGSDAEAERCFRMSEGIRSESGPASGRDRGSMPTSLRRKRVERHKVGGRDTAAPLPRATVRRSHLCGSKSMSDITLEPMQQTPNSNASFDPSGSHQDYTEQVQSWQMQQTQTREKDGEARWQDDLYRWKSHRRSVTSDLHRKKEEREQLQLLAGCRRTARHVGVQEESEWEGVLMFASCQPSRGIPQEPSAAQGPSTRAVPPSQPSAQGEDLHTGSMASNEAFAPSEASPLTSCCNMPRFTSSGVSDDKSTTQVDLASTPASPSENGAHSLSENASGRSCHTDPGLTDQTQEVVLFFNPPEATSPTETSHTDWERPVPVLRAKSLEGGLSGGVCVSATLPRGFRRSEGGSRLSTGVTPRPFRAKPSKVASLPRFYSMDESCSSFTKSPRERPRLPASFTSQGQVVTPDTEGHAGSSLRQSSQKREEEFGEKRQSAPNIHSFMSASVVAAASKPTPAPRSSAQSSKDEVGYSDMRISLNQKPRSGRDFGFQAHWDSTSAHIRSVQPGSPAQLCHLQVGDEIVCVAGRRVAEMSYEQWKACMDAALREGKLLMDVRRHGQNGWSNSPSSLPFKSHKTIDLTSMDSTLAGGPEHHVADDVTGPSLSLEKAGEAQVNGHPANGFSVKAEPESFCDDPVTRRNKGGSESAISDLQVPSISTSTSRWSWDTEEERKRQEKWQMEQERLLQEKYRRDQERLEEEWRRAQEAAAQSDCSGPEMQTQQRTPLPNGNTTSYTPPPFLYQSASSTSAVSSQRAAEAGPAQSRQETKPAGHQTKEECDSPSKASQWLCESYEFAKLTTLDRKKSKSTPSLDSHKIDSRAGGKKKGRLSQAERDRQQILEEMRKKTPLHTDSSWIRQQGTCSVSKEPITVAPMMRRDSLESLHPSSLPRHFSTQCSLGGAAPYRSTSSRRSLGPGSAIFSSTLGQRSVLPGQPAGRPAETVSSPQQRSRLVSGKRACSRCVRPLAKGTAVVIESLDLCFHIGCFKCVSCKRELGRDSESGAQVRVRRRQLFCEGCYSRNRVRPSFSK